MSETTATAPMMTITSIAPWYGGKRTLAPVIVQELGRHHGYFEPFCGGMSVLMAKPPCSHETVNDLHSDLINLARCLADPRCGAQLHRRARRLLCHEDLYREALTRLKAAPDFRGEASEGEAIARACTSIIYGGNVETDDLADLIHYIADMME